MAESIRGKRVVLTGASRGIGRAIAAALIAQGAELLLIGRDRAALETVIAGGARQALELADLRDTQAAIEAAKRGAIALGGVDAFVSAAGIVSYEAVGAISSDALDAQLRVNCQTPLLMAQALLTELRADASFVFVASTLAHAPAPLTTAYAASKAALVAGARTLALELGPRGIRSNVVAPGVVDTEMVRVVRYRPGEAVLDPAAANARIDTQLDALRRLHPLGRLGTADDVAQSVMYLLCAPYVTGHVLNVDGGLMLGSGVL